MEWETVQSDGGENGGMDGIHTERMRVPGGWLYRVWEVWETPPDSEGKTDFDYKSCNTVFVPWDLANGDPTEGELARAKGV